MSAKSCKNSLLIRAIGSELKNISKECQLIQEVLSYVIQDISDVRSIIPLQKIDRLTQEISEIGILLASIENLEEDILSHYETKTNYIRMKSLEQRLNPGAIISKRSTKLNNIDIF